MSKHVKRGPEARQKRRERAAQREGAGTPTPEGQLKVLDKRLGPEVGATKERARLEALAKKSKNQKKKEKKS